MEPEQANEDKKEQNESGSNRKTFLQSNYFRMMIGLAGGAILGLLYWEFIGCNGGSCPLTSNPYKTVAFFAVMGVFMTWDKKK